MSCTHNSAEASCHDDLYRIGEVSQIGGLSQRALRHYDDMKLIEPDVIGENSYRYYSRRTMLKIPVINYLKKMGLSLEEIADVFDCTDFSHIRRSFREQRAECARAVRELNERLEIIDDWNELVEEASFVLNSCPLAVNTKFLSCEEFLCMPYRFTGDYAEATINLEFTAFVDKVENVISGPVIMKREFGDAEPETFTAPCDAAILQKALRPIDPKYAYVRRAASTSPPTTPAPSRTSMWRTGASLRSPSRTDTKCAAAPTSALLPITGPPTIPTCLLPRSSSPSRARFRATLKGRVR